MARAAWLAGVAVGCAAVDPDAGKAHSGVESGTAAPSPPPGPARDSGHTGRHSAASGDTGLPFAPEVCLTAMPESPAAPCAYGPDPAAVAACAAGGFAATLGGAGYPTIDGALTAAVAGDTVIVCPGTWPGGLQVRDAIAVVAADPTPGATVIDGGGTTRGLEVSAPATLRGLTVRAGYRRAGGGGVYVSAAGTTLECLTVEDCDGSGGGGVLADADGLVVRTSTFSRNHADDDGGALSAGAGLVVEDCVFEGNTSGHVGGAVTAGDGASVTRSLFRENLADYAGGALIWGTATPSVLSVHDSVFWCNGAGYQGGALSIGSWGDDLATVSGSVFQENYADYEAGAVVLGSWGSIDLTVTGTTFTANRARVAAGGAVLFGGSLQNGASGWFEDVTFADNTAPVAGGLGTADLGPTYTLTAKRVTFLRNDAHAVELGATSTLTASGCDFGAGADDNVPADARTSAGTVSGLPPDVTL